MRYVLIGLAFVGLIGCEGNAGKKSANTAPAAKTEEHVHGPHGGHPFSLAGLDHKIEAITNKTNNLTQVFFLDASAKAKSPIKAEKVVIKTDKLGGKSFELKAVNPDA